MSEDLNKLGYRAVVGLLHLPGKYAARKLIKFQVVGDAITALALSGAGLIGTGAFCFIDFNLAFHLIYTPLHTIVKNQETIRI